MGTLLRNTHPWFRSTIVTQLAHVPTNVLPPPPTAVSRVVLQQKEYWDRRVAQLKATGAEADLDTDTTSYALTIVPAAAVVGVGAAFLKLDFLAFIMLGAGAATFVPFLAIDLVRLWQHKVAMPSLDTTPSGPQASPLRWAMDWSATLRRVDKAL